MPAGLDTQIGYLWQKYLDLGTHLSNARDSLKTAGANLKIHNYGNAGYFLEKAGDRIGEAADDVYGAADGIINWNIYLWNWVDFNWPDVEGVDMKSILDAMWESEGGQTMSFILYIDAMRGSISEKTVFAPYLASYMRHFL